MSIKFFNLLLYLYLINSIYLTSTNNEDLFATCNHSSMSECPFSDPEYDGVKDPFGMNHNKGIINFTYE